MGAIETRRQIVDAADRLFYENGFEATSFANIAQSVGLSRGNFYYHFRTKDEILGAVIESRKANARALLESFEVETGCPKMAVRRFIEMLVMNREKIMAHGCPVGTLCNELAKLHHGAKDDATGLFVLFREWLARQFTALGRATEADSLALHVLMRSQGVAALATAFHDEDFLRREVEDMNAWLDAKLA